MSDGTKMTIQLEITFKRTGRIVEIVGTGTSVNFSPTDYSKTLNAIIEKLIEMQPDLASDKKQLMYQKQSAEAQLTEIYKEYENEKKNGSSKSKDKSNNNGNSPSELEPNSNNKSKRPEYTAYKYSNKGKGPLMRR
jgi:hypothetical protein